MRRELKIDNEFATIIPPLSLEEYEQLEKNILEEGRVINPIIVWKDTIVDGHNRYRIAAKYPQIEFEITEKTFQSKQDCLDWICFHQLGRRNLDSKYKKYLVGRLYINTKERHGGLHPPSEKGATGQIGQLPPQKKDSRKEVAAITGTSTGYVRHAEDFAHGVDLAEKIIPGSRQKILTGEIKATAGEVSNLVKLPEEKRKESLIELSRQDRKEKPTKEDEEEKKQTPDYRPDYYHDKKPVLKQHEEEGRCVNEKDIIETVRGSVYSTFKICRNYIRAYPTLLTEQEYRDELYSALRKINEFIEELETERNRQKEE